MKGWCEMVERKVNSVTVVASIGTPFDFKQPVYSGHRTIETDLSVGSKEYKELVRCTQFKIRRSLREKINHVKNNQ